MSKNTGPDTPKKPYKGAPAGGKRSGVAAEGTAFGILFKGLAWLFGLAAAGGVAAALGIAFVLAVAFPNLPSVGELANYRPKLPLRVYSADKVLMAEFGEERRQYIPFNEVPPRLDQRHFGG